MASIDGIVWKPDDVAITMDFKSDPNSPVMKFFRTWQAAMYGIPQATPVKLWLK